MSAGQTHSCAILNRAARCWGSDGAGELGDNSNVNTPTPVQVQGLTSGVTAIAAGSTTTCAIVNGGARCWGSGHSVGALGNNSTADSAVPVQVQGLSSGVSAISVGNGFACALANGGVRCWGDNQYGELGTSVNVGTSSPVPIAVSGVQTSVTALSVGWGHACVIMSGGLRCWGSNGNGQLGDSSTVDASYPVTPQGLTSGVTAVAAGSAHTCAVVNGGVRCWGSNFLGQLGNNSTTDSSVPVQVQGLTSGVTAIDAGSGLSCALVNGSARCWGFYGVSGVPNGSSLVPVQVQGAESGVTAISIGGGTACGIISNTARCWGDNFYGEAGTSSMYQTMTAVPTPTTVLP